MYLVPTVLQLNTLQTIWNFGGDFGEVTKGEESDPAKTEKRELRNKYIWLCLLFLLCK